MDELIEKLSSYVWPPDIDKDGKKSFLAKKWTKAQEDEFTEWAIDKLYNDVTLRRKVMLFPRKDKKSIMDSVGMFVFNYSPQTIYEQEAEKV